MHAITHHVDADRREPREARPTHPGGSHGTVVYLPTDDVCSNDAKAVPVQKESERETTTTQEGERGCRLLPGYKGAPAMQKGDACAGD